jgi:hypothetical protein
MQEEVDPAACFKYMLELREKGQQVLGIPMVIPGEVDCDPKEVYNKITQVIGEEKAMYMLKCFKEMEQYMAYIDEYLNDRSTAIALAMLLKVADIDINLDTVRKILYSPCMKKLMSFPPLLRKN